MINIYNEEQIQKITKSCEIISIVKDELKQLIKVGVTPLDLDAHAEKRIIELGAKPAFKGYQGFNHTLCVSVNEDLIHGIPNNNKFKDGDIIKVDMGCKYDGYYSDTAFTSYLGEISDREKQLIATAKDSFDAGINAIKPGARIGDIANAIGSIIKDRGFYTPRDFSGHGIGYSLHEEPYVYNEGEKGVGPLLRDGMVIAIEPMILQGSNNVKVLDDGWTVRSRSGKKASHYEQTVLIKEGYPVILTERK